MSASSDSGPPPLQASALRRATDPATLDSGPQAAGPEGERLALQPRAAAALDLGAGTAARGFNIFAIGPAAARTRDADRASVERDLRENHIDPAATALAVSSLSVACALFLVLELGSPFSGVISVSDQPLLRALGLMNG